MSNLKEYRFDELYQMDSGISTSKDQAGHGAPFVSFREIYNNPILPDILTEKMDTSEEEQKRYSVKKGDIFLTRTSEVLDELAMSSVAVKDYPKATFSGFAKRLRPVQDNITYDKFMAFYLRSIYFRKVINAKAIMTLRSSFNEQIFSYIKLLLPDYDTQVKIGDLFFIIECKIRNNNIICTELEAMAKTIYDYWFLQFEFPNEDGKPYKASGGKMVWNEELKREIPEGWECVQLGEIFSFVKGKIPERLSDIQEEGLHPYITIDVANNEKAEFCSGENMIYCNGEVIMVMDGAASGDVYIGNKGILGSTFAMMKKKRNDISDALIYLILERQSVIYKKANTGSTVPHANRRFIENIKIPISRNMINLSKVFDETCEKIIQNRRENQELISLRDFLLPLLMNGQVGFKK